MQFTGPYLNFAGNAEEAFAFYRDALGGEYDGVVRFRDFGDNSMGVPEADLDKIAHISLPIGEGIGLMGSDVVGQQAAAFTVGNNIYLYLETDTAEEADRLFAALSDSGTVEMPLMTTEWAEKYGTCTDRFGVQWMISYTGAVEFSLG